MNNKCNNCAKFLTCNRKECKKITFVEAGIIDKPKKIKSDKEIYTEILQKFSKLLRIVK